MNQIWIVLKQEYLNRVKKRSFIWMTILGPAISLCILFVPLYLSLDTTERIHVWLYEQQNQQVQGNYSDQSFVFHKIKNQDSLSTVTEFLQSDSDADVLVFISVHDKRILYWNKSGLSARQKWNLENTLQRIYTSQALVVLLPQMAVAPEIQEIELSEAKKNTDVLQLTGLFSAVIIYFFIFYYGVQVMKGVVDEKVNRVVEVILCSVKPFYWMIGKILGIAAVCLTQFAIWVILYVWIWTNFSNSYGPALNQFNDSNIQETMHITKDAWQALEWNVIVEGIESIPLFVTGVSFFIYFILGYLLYASLFAAIGAMTDNETDTQQFTFPITMPLFATFLFAGFIISDPYSTTAIVLSYFPLTSPVAMMLRIPFGIDVWEIVLSVSILLLTFITASYFAAQLFKRGILQYGKALSWKDVWGRR